jgi:hypothetical protein
MSPVQAAPIYALQNAITEARTALTMAEVELIKARHLGPECLDAAELRIKAAADVLLAAIRKEV